MRDLAERQILADHGIHALDTAVYAEPSWRRDYNLAMDAQPQLVTVANTGIPSILANILDPGVVEIILQPLRATEISGGEVKKGDWTTQSMLMPTAEPLGTVASYGDFENAGNVDANVNWVARQPYPYQLVKRMGERQIAMWGLAAIDWSARLDRATGETFGRFHNKSYLFGIRNLQNYGLMNDPSLVTPITPALKAAGGYTWLTATAEEIYSDVQSLFDQLQLQMGGNIKMDDKFVLALSTQRMSRLNTISALTLISVKVALKANFPNMEFVYVPEFTTTSGQLLQMWIPEWQGDQTIWTAFTEKLRAHQVVQQLSAWMQKFSAGTWGAIIRRPLCCGQMLGN